MKVVVTGGAGYVGSVAVQELLDGGHQVLVVDSLIRGGHALLGLYLHDRFRFVRGDIRSRDIMEQVLEGADAVVHLAAIVGDPACASQPELAREVNVAGSLMMHDASRRLGVKQFVFVSTCSNYGKMSDPTAYVTESTELHPVSVYAETKVAVERALLERAGSGIPAVTILRMATLFGVAPSMRFDLTVNEFTAELLTKRRLLVYGEEFWRPYLHVRDAARAIVLVLGTPLERVAGQVFNVGDTGQNYQKRKLVDLICARLGHPVTIERVRKDEDPRDYRVSFEKIQRGLGFSITRTVEDGIQEVIDAIRQGVVGDLANHRERH